MSNIYPFEPQTSHAPGPVSLTDFRAAQPLALADRTLRLAAAFLDALVGCVLSLPLLAGYGLYLAERARDGAQGLDPGRPATVVIAALALGLLATLTLLAAWAAITFYMVSRNGQTLGKRAFGIKVVRTDGTRASLARIFWLRNVVTALPALLLVAIPFLGPSITLFYFLVDALMICGGARQCLHDLVADTLVVRDAGRRA